MFGERTDEAYNRARAKVSHYVKELEGEGFVQRKRLGQRVRIELTPLGQIYTLVQEIRDLKKLGMERKNGKSRKSDKGIKW